MSEKMTGCGVAQVVTPSLLLRPFEESDLDDVHDYAQNVEVTRYQNWGPNSEQQTRDFLIRSNVWSTDPESGIREFAIVVRTTGTVIGGCGLHARRTELREYEVGYTLHQDYWRRGLGTEAVTHLLDFGWNDLDAHRIFALIDPRNAASIGLAESLGFTREGHQKSDMMIQDEWADSYVYARLSPRPNR